MAKKTILKPETLKRLRRIINDKGGIKKYPMDKFLENDAYITIYDTYMNSYEKSIAIKVVGLIYEGRNDDEIQLFVREMKIKEEMNEISKSTNDDDIEAETAAIFIKSKNKVVEGPIMVEVAETTQEETVETENKTEAVAEAEQPEEIIVDGKNIEETTSNDETDESKPTLFMSKGKKVIDVDESGNVVPEYTVDDIGKTIKTNEGDVLILGPIGARGIDVMNKILEKHGDPIVKYKVVNY